ncbi:MAG: hypothetical protein KJ621_02490 [Proteobacteria bacterium]|nr:hypothetical protein [Pseudomonadota bacterium]
MWTCPFSALVGQDRAREALLLAAVAPSVGGVLLRGEPGTAKSTADGRQAVKEDDLGRAARLALPHRVRRQPFQDVDFALEVLNEN